MTQPTALTNEVSDKHAAILEQAVRTFAEVGFRGTDVQVIADRAGVGKGTVYRYFGNKEELFWSAIFEVFRRLGEHLYRSMEGLETAGRQIRAACLAYAEFFQANPVYLEMFVQDRAEFRGASPESHRQHHEKMIEHFMEILQRGIDAGEFRPVEVRKTITALAAMLYGNVVFHCYSHTGHTILEMAQYMVDTFLDGIRADGRDGGGRDHTEPCRSSGSQNGTVPLPNQDKQEAPT